MIVKEELPECSILEDALQNAKDQDAPEALHPPNTSSLAPYLSENRVSSNNGAFIEGCDGIEIKGGKFNQIYGHHTSVTINVSHQPEGHDILQQQSTQGPRSSMSESPSQIVKTHGKVPFQLTDEHDIDTMPTAIYEQHTSSPRVYAPQNSNKIYEQQLGLKGRGFPLWIPEPNKRLPLPYRREGVNIGDVGIITASGGFSFLFNVCLPHGHPINPRTLPEGFAPISPSIESVDICEFSEFKPGSYLASTSIEKIPNDRHSPGLSFETSAAEGAILTLPEGATALDLENVPNFRAYAAANIESWYRYANGPRGREAKNGEIRLVIGCDKATSWGMAAISNFTQHKTHNLKYLPVDVGSEDSQMASGSASAQIPLYKWEYSGLAEARVGPDLREIKELKRNDDTDVAVDGKYWNQCLFLRTLNPMLSDEVFSTISQELEAALNLDSSQRFQNKGDPSRSSCNTGSTTSSQTNDSNQAPQSGASFGTQRGSLSDVSGLTTDSMAVDDIVGKERVTMSRSITAPKSHPSDILNRTLLQTVPGSRVVITQDEDWCSAISETDKIMPCPAEIAERVLAIHDIWEEDGMIFLEQIQKKESSPDFQSGQNLSDTSAKSQTNYMAHPFNYNDSNSKSVPQLLSWLPIKQSLKHSPLACLLCRSRKIVCVPPLPGSADNMTCNQCRRRSLRCEYPLPGTMVTDTFLPPSQSSLASQLSLAPHSVVDSFQAPGLQLQNPCTQDVFQSIIKGRKSWRTLRGGEVVWPPELEAALIEGLENYQPDNSRETRLLGRFPMRNRFISDWIFEKTGKRRTAKQVGSRLQQLRDTCGGKRLLDLLSSNRRSWRTPSPSPPPGCH